MAGSVTQTVSDVWSYDFEHKKIGFRTLVFSCTGDASAGTIPDTATNANNTALIKGWYLIKVICTAGATGPTDNSDVYIKDAYSIDLLGGTGANQLDNTGSNECYPLILTKGGAQPVIGALTLDVDGNSVAANTFTITLIFSKYPLSVNGLT